MVHLRCSSAGVSLHTTQHHSGFEPPFSESLVETPHGVSWLGAGRMTAAVRMAVNQSPTRMTCDRLSAGVRTSGYQDSARR